MIIITINYIIIIILAAFSKFIYPARHLRIQDTSIFIFRRFQ